MATLQTCKVETAPTLPQHAVRLQELNAFSGRLSLKMALNAGDLSVTLDYTALGLLVPPTAVLVIGVNKTLAGQANLYATVIQGWSATQAQVELNAACDVTGRNLQCQIIV